MYRSRPIVALIGAAVALSGCLTEQEPLAPQVTAPSLARAGGSAAAQHLVAFRGKGIPAKFEAAVARLGGTVLFRHEGAGLAMVGGLDEAAVTALRSVASVAQVDVDEPVALDERPARSRAASDVTIQGHTNPATALLGDWQWNMRAINAHHAWAAGKHGSSDVTVAILDTGIDYTSHDLQGLVDIGRSASFVPADDALVRRFFPGLHPIADLNGHGTNVAQQVSSNGVVFAGVTSHTTLIGVKVLDANGDGTLGSTLFGVLWAADQGADVINMSLGSLRLKAGGNGRLQGLLNSVFNYVNRAGSLVVVAAGNEAIDLDRNLVPHPVTGEILHAPSLEYNYCTASHVICVSSVGPTAPNGSTNIPSVFTNFGRSAIDVAAPGGNVGAARHHWPWDSPSGRGSNISWVWSLCPPTVLVLDERGDLIGLPCRPTAPGEFFISAAVGTSQAAPHAAGLAALLIAEERGRKPSQIRAAIRKSAVTVEQPGNDPFFGKGMIDVARALELN